MIQVYTGNGKGKTTAAIGLAIRAAGAGLNVYIAQFAKGRRYSEINALRKISRIKIEQFGRSCFIKRDPGKIDFKLAEKGLKKVNEIIEKGKYRVVILDEINIAVKFKLISLASVIALMRKAPGRIELVFTGRYAHPRVIELADLASDIKEIKHYYAKGVKARRGIEF